MEDNMSNIADIDKNFKVETSIEREGLKFYDRYVPDIDDVMAACRPDYLLYPLPEENKMANADIVQFFAQGKLLPLMQDYHNTYRKKHYTYVTDKGFWCYDEKDIAKCVEKLKKDKHVKFADGLDLDVILSNKNKTFTTSLIFAFRVALIVAVFS